MISITFYLFTCSLCMQSDGMQSDGMQSDGMQSDGMQSDGMQSDVGVGRPLQTCKVMRVKVTFYLFTLYAK